MTRLLLLTENFPPHVGGSGRWFSEIYGRLPADNVRIVAGEHPEQAAHDAVSPLRIERLPVTMSDWGLTKPASLRRYLALARRVRRIVRRDRITALHCGRCVPEGFVGWLVRATTGVPLVCYVHGEDVVAARKSRQLRWMVDRVFKSADLLVANSGNSARLLHEDWRVPAARIRVMHPGVDARRFVPGERDESIRGRLGWSGHTVLLTVGRLQRRKGQDMLIRALPRIARDVPDVLYAIVGDGAERANLERLAVEHGVADRVRFHSGLGDGLLADCYRQCDLFVLPNRDDDGDIEGFGMVLVEAQACGRPVLAGASGGTAETMAIPETGEVVPCETPEPLAAAVVRLLSDRARLDAMGRAGRIHVAARFDWESLADEAAALFGLNRDAAPVPTPVLVGTAPQ